MFYLQVGKGTLILLRATVGLALWSGCGVRLVVDVAVSMDFDSSVLTGF